MFEKEAEEYAHTKHCKNVVVIVRKKCILVKDDYETFKDGAEFGYNKANEWHYVKDEDLPKVGVHVLSEKGTLVIYKGEGFNWVEYSPNADNIKLRKWEEPIAWKEIVLPKESE